MASLRKHPNSRYWVGCFTDNSGKQRQRSTRLTDRAQALRVVQGWELAYRRHLTEIQLRDVFSQMSAEINGQRLNFDTANQYFTRWLKDKEVERKCASFQKYAGVVTRFVKFLGTKAERDLMAITAADVSNYRNTVAQSLKPATVNGHLKILRVALEDAVREGAITQNPAKQVRTIRKAPGSSRRPFTVDEINRLLAVASEEWKGLILAGVCTGQRLGDLARLRWSNIDCEKRIITLRSMKTGKSVNIWIVDPLWDFLATAGGCDDPNAPVFPHAFEATAAAGSVHPLSKEFHSLLVSVGLAEGWDYKKTGTGRSVPRDNTGLSFHALRHTATSFLKRAGVPEAIAMAIIGHSSRAVSDNYTHIDDATVATWMQSAAKSYSALAAPSAREAKTIRIGTKVVTIRVGKREAPTEI